MWLSPLNPIMVSCKPTWQRVCMWMPAPPLNCYGATFNWPDEGLIRWPDWAQSQFGSRARTWTLARSHPLSSLCRVPTRAATDHRKSRPLLGFQETGPASQWFCPMGIPAGLAEGQMIHSRGRGRLISSSVAFFRSGFRFAMPSSLGKHCRCVWVLSLFSFHFLKCHWKWGMMMI